MLYTQIFSVILCFLDDSDFFLDGFEIWLKLGFFLCLAGGNFMVQTIVQCTYFSFSHLMNVGFFPLFYFSSIKLYFFPLAFEYTSHRSFGSWTKLGQEKKTIQFESWMKRSRYKCLQIEWSEFMFEMIKRHKCIMSRCWS